MLGMFIYDNPDTGLREFYRHGHLVIYFDPSEIGRHTSSHPLRWMYERDCDNLGPFMEGKGHGDERDMPEDPLATQLYEDQNR